MHNAITEIKSTLEGTNSREPTVTEAEERISEMEDRMVEINEAERKKEKPNLNLHLEKEEMKNPRVSRRKEIIKIRAEINAKETKETIAKINKAKSWFFEKINKINKPLARLIKKKGRRIKSTKLEMKVEKSQQTAQKYKGS